MAPARPNLPRTIIVALSLAAGALACGAPTSTTPRGGPRGLYASDHRALARHHADEARPGAAGELAAVGSDDPARGLWYRSWDTAEHERLAEVHRSRAAELEADYADWCAGFEPADIRHSPLRAHGLAAWNTSRGVTFYLAPTVGEAGHVYTAIRCHRAWMRLAPAGMDDCPLDLPDLAIAVTQGAAPEPPEGAGAGGITGPVVIVAIDAPPRLVHELQRRAALELEGARAHAAIDAER